MIDQVVKFILIFLPHIVYHIIMKSFPNASKKKKFQRLDIGIYAFFLGIFSSLWRANLFGRQLAVDIPLNFHSASLAVEAKLKLIKCDKKKTGDFRKL